MLKCRVIPVILHKGMGLVKGIQFNSWRRVGGAMQTVKVYNMRDVDELVFFDISATPNHLKTDLTRIRELATECFMPLTVGGGVKGVRDMEDLLKAGADKVALNTVAVENPEILKLGADEFGRQCMVACLDARRQGTDWEVYTRCGQRPTGRFIRECASEMELSGAGEIIVTSIDRDGTMEGYDLGLIQAAAESVQIPVVAAGGAGSYQHMIEAVADGRASAVAAASIFHFTEQTPLEAKRALGEYGIPVRSLMDT